VACDSLPGIDQSMMASAKTMPAGIESSVIGGRLAVYASVTAETILTEDNDGECPSDVSGLSLMVL